MMKGQNWQEFLHNKENKNDLLHMLCEFIKLPENRNKLPCPVIINDKENVHLISKDDDTYLYDVNHEEADTRLILHAIVSGTDAVVVTYTDPFRTGKSCIIIHKKFLKSNTVQSKSIFC